MNELLINQTEAARRLNVHRNYIKVLIDKGFLPTVSMPFRKKRKIEPKELEKLIEQRKV